MLIKRKSGLENCHGEGNENYSTLTNMENPNLEDPQTSVLLTTFTCKKKRCKVFFHQKQLIWDREKPPFAQTTVPIENVISVKHLYRKTLHPLDDPIVDPNNFIIHYAKRGRKSTWKYCNIVFGHSDPLQVSSWVKTLQNHLQSFTYRPKNILVFINPYGGKKNGMKIYEKIAKPLFQLADIDVTVTVSQRRGQIQDFVNVHNLEMFDAISCVGGDGTLSELFNGLVMRECRENNLDIDDINIELPKPRIPIGIIPGGSTDTIAYCMHGSTDIPTAVMHIIFGFKLGLDLVSVYDESKLLRLYASVLSYGYLGDLVHHSDKFRWLGPRRYEYSGFKTVVANNGYEGEIALLTSNNDDLTSSRCFENCFECSQGSLNKDNETTVWKKIRGKYFMISGANISCACNRSPNGISPNSHLGDGNLNIVLVRHTSLLNNVRLLLTLADKNKNIEDLPFVSIYKASEFCFRAIDKTSKWNCDGEIQFQTDIRAKVRCQLLTVYGRGMPLPEETTESSCTCKLC